MSRTSWLSNRPHFLWVYRRDTHADVGRTREKLEWFTSFASVLPTSQLGSRAEFSPRSRRDLGETLGRILATEIQKSRRPKILPRFRNLGGQNPAAVQKSRRPKSCRDSEISAAKILPRFRNLGGQNPAVIPKSRPPKSCRDLAEIQKSLGGQNPASRKDAIVF